MYERIVIIVLLFCTWIPACLHAQNSVNASGGEATGSGEMSFSIGQVVYTVNSGLNGAVSNGVQQPSLLVPLSIELLRFEAKVVEKNEVRLTWETARELNNDFFIVERSLDGRQWEYLTVVSGAGNSSTLVSYSTEDKNPYMGTSYYRLKQTDFDGTYSYSEVETINISIGGISISPNPTSGMLNLVIDKATVEGMSYRLVDLQGKTLINGKINEAQLELNLTNLANGIYIFQVLKREITLETFEIVIKN